MPLRSLLLSSKCTRFSFYVYHHRRLLAVHGDVKIRAAKDDHVKKLQRKIVSAGAMFHRLRF